MVYLGRVVCAIVVVVGKSGFSAGELAGRMLCRHCGDLSPILVGSITRYFLDAKVLWRVSDVHRGALLVFKRTRNETTAGFFPLLLALLSNLRIICRPLRCDPTFSLLPTYCRILWGRDFTTRSSIWAIGWIASGLAPPVSCRKCWNFSISH